MKPLEDLLTRTPKPKVTVTGYRQDLRRNLLNSHRFQTSGAPIYRKAFYVSLGFTAVFAAMLILFILQPAIPNQVHFAFRSDPGEHFLSNTLADSQQMSAPTYNLAQNNTSTFPLDVLEQSYSRDIDEVFVRLLTEGRLKKTPRKIEPVAPSELYSVNRFRVDDRNDVVVYTQVSSIRESF